MIFFRGAPKTTLQIPTWRCLFSESGIGRSAYRLRRQCKRRRDRTKTRDAEFRWGRFRSQKISYPVEALDRAEVEEWARHSPYRQASAQEGKEAEAEPWKRDCRRIACIPICDVTRFFRCEFQDRENS